MIISMSETVKQVLSEYEMYAFLLVRCHTNGMLEKLSENPVRKEVHELVRVTEGITTLIEYYPDTFMLVHKAGKDYLLYLQKESMAFEELETYLALVDSPEDKAALESLYAESQTLDQFYDTKIVDGFSVLMSVDKDKCTSVEATRAECQRLEEYGLKTLQRQRRVLEEVDQLQHADIPQFEKEYEIALVKNIKQFLDRYLVLPREARHWAQRLGMRNVEEKNNE